jgi:predicted RND superfamily exporter protein
MNTEFLQEVAQSLKLATKQKYNFDEPKLFALSAAGQNSLTQSLKSYVLKNGTSDIENILLGKLDFNGSKLQEVATDKLRQDLKERNLADDSEINEISVFSTNYLINEFKEGFMRSGNTKDLDGICQFLGIDKSMLKMINSPVGKMFGKFFK